MPKTTAPEWLLARLTDQTRATAIMGDLEELAATRDRFWFWTNYFRALISLGWRAPVAFIAGYAAIKLVILAIEYWIVHTPLAWRTALRADIATSMGPLITIVTLILWFTLPYGLIRYGWQDKFVQLAATSTLLASVIFFYPPILSPIFAIVFTAVAITLLVSPVWRGAAIVLGSTVTAGSVAIVAISFAVAMASIYISEQLHPGRLFKRQSPGGAVELASLLILAFVCSRLHARLLRPNLAGGSHAEPA